jgi:ribosomal protein S18 acetylase RimI-like enzyme
VSAIRPLRREDREPIRQLLVETEVFTEEEVGIALELIDVVLNKPDQKDYIINSYVDGGKILGYYCVGPTPATESTFDLYWIATKPSGQRKGVGSALDEHATNLIANKGGKLVVAETSSQPKYEKTRQFYLTRGYAELARIRDYYRTGDDLVVYGKYLT